MRTYGFESRGLSHFWDGPIAWMARGRRMIRGDPPVMWFDSHRLSFSLADVVECIHVTLRALCP